MNASHLGLNRTNDMVANKYCWPGLFMMFVPSLGTRPFARGRRKGFMIILTQWPAKHCTSENDGFVTEHREALPFYCREPLGNIELFREGSAVG